MPYSNSRGRQILEIAARSELIASSIDGVTRYHHPDGNIETIPDVKMN